MLCIREALGQAGWVDGKITAGYQSAKHNLQLPEGYQLAQDIGAANDLRIRGTAEDYQKLSCE